MEAIPIPFEQEDPVLGNLVARWILRRHGASPFAARMLDMKSDRMFEEIRRETRAQPRNAPCGCGSGQKAKKCCSALV
jgi:hypothetical protein